MMSFAELVTEDIRLIILRSIADDGYSLNEAILQEVLNIYGHNVGRDRVRTEMQWLSEQGLISIDNVAGFMVGRLTGKGQDCASGKCRVPGVKKPRPEN
jgi:repressor of nif and glnA expression